MARPTKEMQIVKFSRINASPALGAIMEKYNLLGSSMSTQVFYDQYVKLMDPNITIDVWKYYIRKFKELIKIKSEEIVKKVADTQISDAVMQSNTLRKIVAITDISLDKVIENPNLLENIPLEQRITWLFNAMKAQDSRMVAAAKLAQEKRKTSMYEDMLQGAQYGAIEASDISDKPEKEPNAPLRASQPAKTPIPEKTAEFTPAEFNAEQYGD